MGIRVHKAIGYGIDDLRTKPGKDEYHHAVADDPRYDGQAGRAVGERAYDMDASAFKKWCAANEARIQALSDAESPVPDRMAVKLVIMGLGDLIERKQHWNLGQSFVHQDEFGLPNVLLVIDPPSYHSWCRYDETLDWTEETDQHGSRNRVVRLRRPGIHPYDTRWKRVRLAEPGLWQSEHLTAMGAYYRDQCKFADEHGPVYIDAQAYSHLTGRWDPGLPAEARGPLHKHLLDDYRPSIPPGILAVLLWHEHCFPLGLQPVLDAMRPLLYVWWG